MNINKVKKAIDEIKIRLEKQEHIKDERLENHLDNLEQLLFELIKKNEGK